MHLRTRNQFQPIRVVAFLLMCLSSLAIALAEEALDQAQQLRERGQYDAALEVFRRLAGDMLLDKDDRATAAYEIGVTPVHKARTTRDPMIHQGCLDEAHGVLKQFVTRHAEHPLVSSARCQLGNVLVERAKTEFERSKNAVTSQGHQRAISAARGHFEQALQVFSDSLAQTRKELERIGPLDPKKDRKRIEIRKQLRANHLQARLSIPATKEEQAGTFSDGSAERRRLLQSAVKGYGECHRDYRTRIAGLYGLLYQGRCYVKLDDHKNALECFDDLLDQPDGPAFRPLKLKSALLAADCWLDDRRKAHARAIEIMQGLVDKATTRELSDRDWLWLRVNLARAYKLRADELSKAKQPSAEQKQQRKQAITKALEHARSAAKTAGDHAEQARAIVTEITETSESEISEVEFVHDEIAADDIKGFDDAYRAGRELVSRMNQPETRRDKAALQKVQRESIRLLKLALDSAEVDTPTEDVNVARYLLAYAYYSSGNYAKASETGEFLARRFPKHNAARFAGKIALAAYLKEYEKATAKQRRLLATRLASLCRHSMKTWPDEYIAVNAAETLTMLALRDKELDEAAASLELVPEDAPKRGSLEIQLGQFLWYASLSEADEEKGSKFREKARRLLEKGIRRPVLDNDSDDLVSAEIELESIGPPKVSQLVAIGALSLSQIYVSEGKFAKAVALLEDKEIGPHTLVVSKHPVANEHGFDVQTLLVAKRAYRGLVESEETDAATQKEAERKLKEAIVELDTRRKEFEKREGDIDVDLTPVE